MEYKKYNGRTFRHLVSAPIIYSMTIPLLIFDFWLELYHRFCFPMYGIPYIKRAHYIKIDRHKLSYLSLMEKLNCAYCGYANGLLAYGVKIAGETEKYWCGIKHKPDSNFIEPMHHNNFIEYGNKTEYENLPSA